MVEITLDPYDSDQQGWYINQIASKIIDPKDRKFISMTTVPGGLMSGLRDVRECYRDYLKNGIGATEIQIGLSAVGIRSLYAEPIIKEYIEFIDNTRKTEYGDSDQFRLFETIGHSFEYKYPTRGSKNQFTLSMSDTTDKSISNLASQMLLSRPYIACMSFVNGCLQFLDRKGSDIQPRPKNLSVLMEEWAIFKWKLIHYPIVFQLNAVRFDTATEQFVNPITTKTSNGSCTTTNDIVGRLLTTQLPQYTFSYRYKKVK